MRDPLGVVGIVKDHAAANQLAVNDQCAAEGQPTVAETSPMSLGRMGETLQERRLLHGFRIRRVHGGRNGNLSQIVIAGADEQRVVRGVVGQWLAAERDGVVVARRVGHSERAEGTEQRTLRAEATLAPGPTILRRPLPQSPISSVSFRCSAGASLHSSAVQHVIHHGSPPPTAKV